MKLRFILKLLTLSALLSVTLAGYVCFYPLKNYYHQEAQRQAFFQVQTISRYLSVIIMVTDPNGVIFISNQSEWLYHLAWGRNSKWTKSNDLN